LSTKAKIEAIIYAAEEPITLDQIGEVLLEAGLAEQLLQPAAESEQAAENAEPTSLEKIEQDAKAAAKEQKKALRNAVRAVVEELIAEYNNSDRGMEIRQVASGYRVSTKPEHHDVVKSFAKSLKPPIKLSLQALETLAVIAYKQPVTAPEISEIRGVDSSGVLATLIERKLITTAGRKQVIGRPMLYKTTKDFLMRFGLSDLAELPSMEEFEKMTQGAAQEELFGSAPVADATGVPDVEPEAPAQAEATAESTEAAAGEQNTEPAEAHNS
jgi:segregation and condensation protein B